MGHEWGFWDEYGGLVIFAAMITIIVVLCGGLFAGIYATANNRDTVNAQAKHDLQIQGYTVYDGVVNSPTVIQTTDDYVYFTRQVTTEMPVYQAYISNVKGYIAIFNETYGLAYELEYKTSYFWGF
jgi:hypothetical protein